ncbi:MAG TPA: cyclic nucleotide-binding domain-containing protein [Actinomycetota bacterium]|nr:cyclic nucleotide-binding domain-containing protein [Actinomycetota bacterium]
MKDALDSLADVVPPGIASLGARTRPAPSGRRRDRPLGKRGRDVLARVPLFAGLSRRHLRQVAEHADEVGFRPGETIVQAGMLGGAFFLILEGEAKVTKGRRTLLTLRPGEFFGELALLDGGPRTASVVATTPMVCIRIFKRAFDRLVREEPGVAAKMLAVLAGRLRRVEKSITG